MRNWQPVLQGSSLRQAWAFIEELDKETHDFENNYKAKTASGNWLGNTLGASLFCHYLFKVSGEKQYQKRAESFINFALDASTERVAIDRLHSGLAGLAWLTEHLNSSKKWPKNQDPNEDFDKYLISKARKACAKGAPLGMYGLVDDWVGYGIYALERWPHGQTPLLIKTLVKLFDKKAKKNIEGGTAWYSTKKVQVPFEEKKEYIISGNYNLGVAHGIPGVIAFLTNVVEVNQDSLALELLKDSIRWLKTQDKGEPFGYVTPEKSKKYKGTPRVAWCYGDLGISIVLLNAAKVLKDQTLKEYALSVAKRAALTPHDKCGVVDPFICHGSGGNFHIFNRLYQSTGDELFLKRALKWSDETFTRLKDENECPFGPMELITGQTGLALSLLSGVSNIEPKWDRYCLMS